jgi:hypothetical protein
MQDGAPKLFAFPVPAWLDQISGQMDWESMTKKIVTAKSGFYSGVTSF